MMKKSLIILILVFIGIVFFAVPREKENKKTFSFWTIQLKAPAGDIIQKNIDIFQKKHPEIEVQWVDIPIGEAQKRTIASILGGNPPDLINLNPEFSLSLAQKNTLLFFDEKDVKDYNKGIADKLRYNGKIYALPFYATSAVTVLNKEKFKNCDINLKTYDDIIKLSKCKNSPVFGASLNENDSFAKILNKYDVNKDTITPENLDEVYKEFYKLNENGLLLKDTLTVNHRENVEKYMSGAASFIVAGGNFINMIKENAPDVYKNSVVLPQLTGSNKQFDVSVMNFVVPAAAKNKELAKEFAALLLNPENQMALSKKTNVLPVNNSALSNPYFKNCGEDLVEIARCIGAKQLNSPLKKDFGYKNKKEINDLINNSLEILFLKGEKEFDPEKLYKDIKTEIK